jgi:prevent-host-death family protein
MASHSIAEAKKRLPELIDRALRGEDVVITRGGHPVIALKPISPPPRRITLEDIAWLDAHKVGRTVPAENTGKLVSLMRDEDWP